MDDGARRQAPLSPLYGDLAGMPPALLIVGSRDPLLDDTVRMAQRWGQVAEAELEVVSEAPHGFIHFPTAMAAATREHVQAWVGSRITAAQAAAPLSASALHAPRAARAIPAAPR